MTSPSVDDHLRPTDADYPDGTYRVVGTDGNGVTALRVGAADGRRVHTGELHAIAREDLAGFEPVGSPDGNRPLGVAVASMLETGYWSVRVFGQQLAAHPLPAAVALALVLVGFVGEDVLRLPETVAGVVLLVGSLGLVYVGSGRL
ncbi:hypothetical protein HUG10_09385 [Halorarum halophilum]|uniref:Uncharacterized protein n=1 Tax=Halorarum halophilum TaxID=2743090 RepID=A0A7D5GZZ1_9EURY|nr:hypothetical protein [Halobaculum halophilum]QLG27753.1 hypothetical protein HUG10_09385 [Halobaculum halophilum]